MYNQNNIIECLRNLVGFRQNTSDCGDVLDASVMQSDSGMYFDDYNSLCRTNYLDQIFDKVVYSDWVNTTTYSTNTRITYAGNVYASLQSSNIANQPDITPLFWQLLFPVRTLNNWLYEKRDAAIMKVVNEVFNRKKLLNVTKSIFTDKYIFNGIGNPNNTEQKNGRFVGWRLALAAYENLELSINKLGIQLNGAANFNMYLYHTSQPTPLQTIPITVTTPYKFTWQTLTTPIKLQYADPNLDNLGAYYLGYYENDLPIGVFAVNKQAANGFCPLSNPCLQCAGGNDFHFFHDRKNFFTIQPIHVINSNLNGIDLFNFGTNEANIIRDYNKTFGLNCNISISCELSALICRQKNLLVNLIGYAFANDMLSEIENSLRINRQKSELYNLAAQEINKGSKDFLIDNITSKFNKEIAAIQFDLSDLHTVCLPCDRKRSITFTTRG